MCHWFCQQDFFLFFMQLMIFEIRIWLSETPRQPGFVAITTGRSFVAKKQLSERQQLVGDRVNKNVGTAPFHQNLQQ